MCVNLTLEERWVQQRPTVAAPTNTRPVSRSCPEPNIDFAVVPVLRLVIHFHIFRFSTSLTRHRQRYAQALDDLGNSEPIVKLEAEARKKLRTGSTTSFFLPLN
jgi:hypothetical protein